MRTTRAKRRSRDSRSRSRSRGRGRGHTTTSGGGGGGGGGGGVKRVGWRGVGDNDSSGRLRAASGSMNPLVWWGLGLLLVLLLLQELVTTVFGWLWLLLPWTNAHGAGGIGGGGGCAPGYSLVSVGSFGQPVCQPTVVTSLFSSFIWTLCLGAAFLASCLFVATRMGMGVGTGTRPMTTAGAWEAITSSVTGAGDLSRGQSTAQMLRCVRPATVTRFRDLPPMIVPDSSSSSPRLGAAEERRQRRDAYLYSGAEMDMQLEAETVGTVFPDEVVWASEITPCTTSHRLRALIDHTANSSHSHSHSHSGVYGGGGSGGGGAWGWVSLVSAEGERLFETLHPRDVSVPINGRLSPSHTAPHATAAVTMAAYGDGGGGGGGGGGYADVFDSDVRVARLDPELERLCITVGTVYDPHSSPKPYEPLTLGATPVAFGPHTDLWLTLPLPLALVATDPPGGEATILRNSVEVVGCVAVVHRGGKVSFVEAVRNCQRAGALAVIIVNSQEQPHQATATWTEEANAMARHSSSGGGNYQGQYAYDHHDAVVEIPAMTVRRSDGELLWARLDDGEVVLLEDVAYTAEAIDTTVATSSGDDVAAAAAVAAAATATARLSPRAAAAAATPATARRTGSSSSSSSRRRRQSPTSPSTTRRRVRRTLSPSSYSPAYSATRSPRAVAPIHVPTSIERGAVGEGERSGVVYGSGGSSGRGGERRQRRREVGGGERRRRRSLVRSPSHRGGQSVLATPVQTHSSPHSSPTFLQ
jgi:hypothetical protein